MQKMADTADPGIVHITEILFSQVISSSVVTAPSSISPRINRMGHLTFVIISLVSYPPGEAVKIIKQRIEICGIKLPQASGKEKDPLTGDTRIILYLSASDRDNSFSDRADLFKSSQRPNMSGLNR